MQRLSFILSISVTAEVPLMFVSAVPFLWIIPAPALISNIRVLEAGAGPETDPVIIPNRGVYLD